MSSRSGRYKQKWISSLLLLVLLLSWLPSVTLAGAAHHQPAEMAQEVPCESQQGSAALVDLLALDVCQGNACIQCTYCAGLVTHLPYINVHQSQKPFILHSGLPTGIFETLERPPKHPA